ncbi:MAG: NADH-quinone oxidoreductase subunit J [Candidatus Kapabacteria bacterium]|nr:NADH-quinone oxidoreductase subunit J [Candidatus Kapabacteria bacterium]
MAAEDGKRREGLPPPALQQPTVEELAQPWPDCYTLFAPIAASFRSFGSSGSLRYVCQPLLRLVAVIFHTTATQAATPGIRTTHFADGPSDLPMSLDLTFFIILATMAAVSAVMVIMRKNPISSALSLVLHFVSLAGLYLTLHAQFMAVIQMLVYAGAIMVLVVFVIMLLHLRREEKMAVRQSARAAIGIGATMVLGAVLIYGLTQVMRPVAAGSPQAMANGEIAAVGKALFSTAYVFPFEMVSLVLLAAAVGSVVLTKRNLK